jgi:hypothetical protein
VSPTSARLCGGRSTPATRAIFSKYSPVILGLQVHLPSGKPQSQIENRLSLPLFMFGVYANHPHHTFAMDDLALVAHFFYGSTDFHLNNPQIFQA